MLNRIVDNCLRFPCILNIELTDYCPLNCKQCYKNLNSNYIDFNYLKKIINEAIQCGTKRILLSGGEPLLYPGVYEAIKLIKSTNTFVCLSTSGYNICEEIVEQLIDSRIDLLYISLNASNEKINSLSRDGYNHAINAMHLLSKYRIRYRINWVARHDNIKDLSSLIRIGKNNGADGIDILKNMPNNMGLVQSELNFDDFKILENIYRENIDYLEIQSCFLIDGFRREDKVNDFFSGCLAGRAAITVFSDGKFSICPHIYDKNSYQSIIEYWDDIKNKYINNKACKLLVTLSTNEKS